jgi:hypothetical protein
MGGPPWPPLSEEALSRRRGGHGVTELVVTSRYSEKTAFASFAVLCELCVQRISLSRADSLRKARRVPQSTRRRVVSKEDRPYRTSEFFRTLHYYGATALCCRVRI